MLNVTFKTLFMLLSLTLSSNPTIAQNLIQNPGFESGTSSWVAWGGATLEQSDVDPHSGLFAVVASNRTAIWQGPVQPLLGVLEPGRSYRVSAWVRIAGSDAEPVGMTMAREDDRGLQYLSVSQSTAFNDRWVQISEVYDHSEDGALTRLDFYFQGPAPGIDLLVDDVAIEAFPADWVAAANQRIDELRKRDVAVAVRGGDGQPIAGATVTLEQMRRAFPIGTTIRYSAFASSVNYRDYIVQHFNWGVHENAAKWYANEPNRNQVSYARADEILDWADANGIEMRGHTIFWAPEIWQPNWLPALNDVDLTVEVEDRLEDVVAHFQGRFRHWDVNNEMLHGSFFADRLGADIRDWMFERTRQIDPDATLFLNDFAVVAGTETSSYVRQIRGFLDRGIPVDAIGVQGHFNDASPFAIQLRLDMLAELGLPIWITELDVVQANESDRADALETVLRMAYSHPAVDGILLWGFWAGAHWKGPDAALVDEDWTVNAAGRRFDALLAEWSSDQTLTTDATGIARARVFHGNYRFAVGTPDGATVQFFATIAPGQSEILVPADLGALFMNSFEADR